LGEGASAAAAKGAGEASNLEEGTSKVPESAAAAMAAVISFP
jgi:hypothetical protein